MVALAHTKKNEVLFENALAGSGCQAFVLPTMRTSAPLVPKNAVEDALAGKSADANMGGLITEGGTLSQKFCLSPLEK